MSIQVLEGVTERVPYCFQRVPLQDASGDAGIVTPSANSFDKPPDISLREPVLDETTGLFFDGPRSRESMQMRPRKMLECIERNLDPERCPVLVKPQGHHFPIEVVYVWPWLITIVQAGQDSFPGPPT